MSNKIMFCIGIILVLIAAASMVGNLTGEVMSPTVLGIIGIVFIAASRYRLSGSKKT